jgi:CRP/FNR family transcriptional regulator, cyclic AMP receptor protein
MPVTVRSANAVDSPHWAELAQSFLGSDYPSKELFQPDWVKRELDPNYGQETWVAEMDGDLQASISILKAPTGSGTTICNLGRNMFKKESFSNGAAKALLQRINELAMERGQSIVVRVPASDNEQQILFENLNYSCVGFQPLKHMIAARVGALFYVRSSNQMLITRTPMSESLSQISELASATFERLKISNPLKIRDGTTGYPLQMELEVKDATFEEFVAYRKAAEPANPPREISGTFNIGRGIMRVGSDVQLQGLLGIRDGNITCGVAICFDDLDRCGRIVDGFATDDLSMGTIFQLATKIIHERFNTVYIEVDILASAPRLLKSAEQLGFVPVAYMPAFYAKQGSHADVVKMVKLNMAYALENVSFTTHSRGIAEIVDRNFQDQKVGNAIINLLRGLPIFEGLGDGELRKMARLFTQKLFRPGERIFKKGDSGEEAYIIMRGQVDIQLDETSKPIAAICAGKIFGELAFLDGAPRNAYAVAGQASILLVVQRSAFQDLVQREPHLGMLVMRNVAMDLSNKLRQANTAISTLKKDG